MSSNIVSARFTRAFIVMGAVVVGCGGPESFHPSAAAGSAGLPVIPVLTGDAGASGAAGLTGFGGDIAAGGTAGTDIAGAGGNPLGVAGTSGAAQAGNTGLAGTTGEAGTTGGAGTTGVAGATGIAGATGVAGTNGVAGAAGGSGVAGAMGVAGVTGAAGSGGVAGSSGVPPAQPYAATGWVPTASITAAGNADVPANVLDGKIATRWTTGRNQTGNETFTVDLGASKPVSRVVLDDTTHPMDFPAAYTLEASTSTTFTPVKMGAGAVVTDISFPTVTARYLRLRQTGKTSTSWWSIDELHVYP